jgi:hypothetical protein
MSGCPRRAQAARWLTALARAERPESRADIGEQRETLARRPAERETVEISTIEGAIERDQRIKRASVTGGRFTARDDSFENSRPFSFARSSPGDRFTRDAPIVGVDFIDDNYRGLGIFV